MPEDPSKENYQERSIEYWNSVALNTDTESGWGRYYYKRIEEIYRLCVMPGRRVIEIGCGQGNLLAALEPSTGVGVDFSEEMIRKAREKHPHLRLIQADAHQLELDETFDVVILSDLLNYVWDVQKVFERIKPLTTPTTRLIINGYSKLWELPLNLVRRLGLAKPAVDENWLTVDDMKNLLDLTDFEVIRNWSEVLLPLEVPYLADFSNKLLAKIWPFRWVSLCYFIISRPKVQGKRISGTPRVSVVVPARNEAGNISEIFRRVPKMGSSTELVFVEGDSQDGTYQVIEKAVADNPGSVCKLLKQGGRGKGDAVRLGFEEASGDVLMILDADLTMPPEDLPRFYEALVSGKGDFINGVRLVYPMEKGAMRFFNQIGNKFFSLAFSWLLGQPIKDTLCGTKILWKKDYEMIAANRSYFGDFDPFGDFDLIFGAAKLNLKILDMPIRYRERTYGTTNIQRWKHGLMLLRMVAFAARRIRFV